MPPPVRFALCSAALVPVIYFGAQLLAAPFYPGYSYLSNTASQLGSDLSAAPAVLNSGALLAGCASLLGAYGLLVGLATLGVPKWLRVLVALCNVSGGAAALWAGTHPLPSPEHNPGALAIGLFAMPVVVAAAVWRAPVGSALRAYVALNLMVFGAVALLMSGIVSVDRQLLAGLLQRVVAATLYIPSAVVACVLMSASGRHGSRRSGTGPDA